MRDNVRMTTDDLLMARAMRLYETQPVPHSITIYFALVALALIGLGYALLS